MRRLRSEKVCRLRGRMRLREDEDRCRVRRLSNERRRLRMEKLLKDEMLKKEIC